MFQNNKKWIFLFLLAFIWGSSFILIKKGLIGFTPLQLGSLRIIITALLLFLVGFKSLKNLPKNTLKWIFISGFLGTFFPAFLFAYAETEIDSAIASILNSIVPINTIVFGFLAFKMHSSKRQILGVLTGFIGTFLLITNGASINPNQNYWYAFLVIIATVMYAFSINIIKRHLQNVSPIAIAVGNFAIIIIPAFIVLIFSGFFTSQVIQGPDFTMSLFYIFLLSLFGTAIAKVLFNNLVQISTPIFASSVTYMMPIIAVSWGVLDGESFGFWQGVATVIILLGVYLANSKR
ncbi:EamA family transporter [Flavobacteriaceae bacterium]|jgi:drug/metabolite transporter (DMT)-like permease|nr:permease [Flavobacteriaceae bacterium]MDA9025564.1 EamA family transporter [bacterium]MBT3587843.1 EamA family transporter [Flavobacteriaceae bacterium]MDA7824737.1 EamA family transporter [Flavobacteriaceae bacterium]MDA9342347.1 EamA family transporter [Flavobacteriaceae bacterium]|tara:strand:+ start:4450 stop:5325 length:876 start_codon:yes stop_codon:yes gene_type:complete